VRLGENQRFGSFESTGRRTEIHAGGAYSGAAGSAVTGSGREDVPHNRPLCTVVFATAGPVLPDFAVRLLDEKSFELGY
jgi:hypothetical protein